MPRDVRFETAKKAVLMVMETMVLILLLGRCLSSESYFLVVLYQGLAGVCQN